MLRLDLSYFYRLSLTFDSARRLESDVVIGDVWFGLFSIKDAVQNLFNEPSLKGCFRSSASHASQLYKWLDALVDRDWKEQFTAFDKAHLVGLVEKFEIVMSSELAVIDTYIVVEKPPFSTISLITSGEVLFPHELTAKVPAAVNDMREAGKCLAFELPTACGFHTLRAVEAVLRRYWEVVTGNLPKPKQRNIGVYLQALTDADCGDPKVISALRQLKDLHRNVIFHPEVSLSVEEAISLVGLARSLVGAMLERLPALPLEEGDQAQIDFDEIPTAAEAAEDAAIATDAAAEAAEAAGRAAAAPMKE